jgi:hypothetical protein
MLTQARAPTARGRWASAAGAPAPAGCERPYHTANRRAGVARAGGTGGEPRLQRALAAIDELNARDPRRVTWQGEEQPYELA